MQGSTVHAGLSPASVGPSGDGALEQGTDALEKQQLVEWARSEGLSGLSPASLRPIEDDG